MPTLAIANLLASSCAFAVDAAQSLSQLHHTAWTTSEGAPGDIQALAQTPDGLLWLGTGTGLFYFDGVTFQRFSPRPSEASLREDITALCVAPNGDLWIGTRFGGIHVLHIGKLSSFGLEQGLPKRTIQSIAVAPDGRIWAGNVIGPFVFDGRRWKHQQIELAPANAAFKNIVFDRYGTLWVGSSDGVFFLRQRSSSFERVAPPLSYYVLLDPSGSAWAEGVGFAANLTDKGPRSTLPRIRSSGDNFGLLFDRESMFWRTRSGAIERLPTADLVAQRGDSVQEFTVDHGLSGARPQTALEDNEGNVWIGTNAGLDRFRDNKLMRAGGGRLQIGDAALAVASDHAVWAGTDSYGLLNVSNDVQVMNVLNTPGVAGVTAIHRGRDGVLWLGGGGDILRSQDGRFVHVPVPFGGLKIPMQALVVDAQGDVWASETGSGVWRLHDRSWIQVDGVAGLFSGPALCLRADGNERMWLGYTDGKVALVDHGSVKTFGASEGVTIGNVLSIFRHGNDVWFGGNDGVMFFRDGRFHSLESTDPNALLGVSGIVNSANGDLWFNGASAIARLPASEIAALSADPLRRVSVEVLDSMDGRNGPAEQLRPLNTAISTPDGRLWFATTQDVYWLDPDRIHRNTVAPAVLIRSIDDGMTNRKAVNGLALPQGTTNLDIEYTATSLRMPERVKFRYRLDRVDKVWRDAGVRRRVDYVNLRPGSYRFDVIASNEDGVWSTTGATLSFTIAAAFYQQLWFEVLCLLAALACVLAFARMRLRQVAARVRLQVETRSKERERIARELHDTMLQGAQGLVLSFQVLADKLPRQDAMRQSMERILDQADDVIAQTRDSVLSLRTEASIDQDLPARLQEVVDELNAEGLVAATLHVAGSVTPLSEDVREDVFRIAREAMLNAFRHARARHVEVELSYDPLSFRIRICDDGVGIDSDTLASGVRPGHWGLVGMRERAARIGSELTIESGSGQGTLVTLAASDDHLYSNATAETAWQRFVKFTRVRMFRRPRADRR